MKISDSKMIATIRAFYTINSVRQFEGFKKSCHYPCELETHIEPIFFDGFQLRSLPLHYTRRYVLKVDIPVNRAIRLRIMATEKNISSLEIGDRIKLHGIEFCVSEIKCED